MTLEERWGAGKWAARYMYDSLGLCLCFIWVQNVSDSWFTGFRSREEKSVIQMVGISFQPLHLEYVFNKMLNTMGIAVVFYVPEWDAALFSSLC